MSQRDITQATAGSFIACDQTFLSVFGEEAAAETGVCSLYSSEKALVPPINSRRLRRTPSGPDNFSWCHYTLIFVRWGGGGGYGL